MPLPLLAAAAIPAIGSLLGGIFGNKAAKKAAQVQADAARLAGQQVIDTTNEVNPTIRTAADYAGRQVIDAGADAGAGVWSSTDRANAILNPYSGAGTNAAETLNSGLAEGGTFNRTPTQAELMMDPGFAFRLAEGQKALERSAAARGSGMGGGALKAITRYAQDYSSGEYNNAFARYRSTTQDRYNNLFGVANLGAQVGTQQGNNLTAAGRYSGDVTLDTSKYAGNLNFDATNRIADNTINATRTAADYNTSAAAAQAGGIVGGSNALWGGISNAANGVGEALTLQNLLKNPATSQAFRMPQPIRYGSSYGVRH